MSVEIRVSAPAATVRISAVQMRSGSGLPKNAERIAGYLRNLAAEGVQIAVFPECALTSYVTEVIKTATPASLESAIDSIAAACRDNRICAVVGTPFFRPDGKLWNSAVVFDSDGKIIERYHKVHLAEEWPEPGDHLAFFDIAGVKATIIICHDGRYPELVRIPVIAGARLVFQLSCGSSVKVESKLGPSRAQAQARAVENSVWFVQANAPANDDLTGSHGQSKIIKPDGNIVLEGSIFGEDVLTAEIDMAEADGLWARNSLNAEFLREFWEAGLKVLSGESGRSGKSGSTNDSANLVDMPGGLS